MPAYNALHARRGACWCECGLPIFMEHRTLNGLTCRVCDLWYAQVAFQAAPDGTRGDRWTRYGTQICDSWEYTSAERNAFTTPVIPITRRRLDAPDYLAIGHSVPPVLAHAYDPITGEPLARSLSSRARSR